MRKREANAGYTIIEKFAVGEQGFAIGESQTAPAKYVTWQFRADDNHNYFWGHYLSTKEAAYTDYQKRINDEVQDTLERTGKSPLLPEMCLTVEPITGNLINIKRGESGYYGSDWNKSNDREYNRNTADMMNERWGVTKAQEAAMLHGSMVGWHTKGANPLYYDGNGMPKREKKRDEMER